MTMVRESAIDGAGDSDALNAPVDTTPLATLVGAVIARRQSIQSLACALVIGMPAELCCIFQESQHKLEYVGGIEIGATQRQHKPSSRLLARISTIAMRAGEDDPIRQQNALQANAVWQALLVVPLLLGPGRRVGIIVLGRRAQAFAADEIAGLQAIMPELAQTLDMQTPPATIQTLYQDVLAASGIHPVEDLFEEPAPTVADLGSILFHATDEALLLIDQGYVIRGLNPALRVMTGWDEQVIGQRCSAVITCHDATGVKFCGTSGCPLVSAAANLTTPPAPRPIVFVATTQPAARAVGVGAIALGAANAQRLLLLRDAQPLVAATHQRDEFLGEVSHKMRNRLNTIHGFIELVAGGHAGEIGESQQRLLSYAHTSSIELMEYVENLLYLTRVDGDQLALRFDTLDVAELLEEVEHYTSLEASNAQVLLLRDTLPSLPVMRGDRERLRQALLNLTTNAIKFTNPGGTVRLSAYDEGNQITILIADTGIGIAADDGPRIFERDYQSERTARMGKSGGGMGLATAKAIVEHHGGAIRFETEIDQGTTFFVHLPVVD